MSENKQFKDPEKQSFSKIFLVLSAVLGLCLLTELYLEAIGRQPWKQYQNEFRQLELTKLEQELKDKKAEFDKKQEVLADAPLRAQPTSQKNYRRLLTQAEALISGKYYKESMAELARLKGHVEDNKVQHQFVKADMDAAYYRFDLAKEAKQDTTALLSKIQEYKSTLQKNEEEAANLTSKLAAAHRKVRGIDDELEQIKKEMDAQTFEIVSLEQRIAKIQARPPEINQIVVSHLGEYQKVDRCVTCHAGIDRPEFEKSEKLVFRTHPNHKELFKHHPIAKAGCTVCHDGQGRALNVAEAHSGDKHWNAPLLKDAFIQTSCVRCHENAPLLANATAVSEGAHIFQEKGCGACHKVDNSAYLPIDPSRIGPELVKVKNKVQPEWLLTWIKNPKSIHPRTYMPQFGAKDVGLPDEEVESIATYLLINSKPFKPTPEATDYRNNHKASPSSIMAGEKLFGERGCMGCHELGDYRALGPRHIALDGAGSKLSREWIYSWIENPSHYSATTVMPKFPLSRSEKENLADFVSSLKKQETNVAFKPVDPHEFMNADRLVGGKNLIKKYGCYSCHKIPGFENNKERIGPELTEFADKDPHMLFWGNKNVVEHDRRNWYTWTKARLLEPKSFETDRVEAIMPNLNLKDNELDKILLYLKTMKSTNSIADQHKRLLKEGEKEQIAGTQLLHRYGCIGCHSMYDSGKTRIVAGVKTEPVAAFGKIAPNITPEGDRVQTSWLADFLNSPFKMRPYLPATMPKFNFQNDDVRTIIGYFKASATMPEYFGLMESADISPVQNPHAGEKLLKNYQCVTCHKVNGSEIPSPGKLNWYKDMKTAKQFAPDLVYSMQRLNPAWANKWIENPHLILPDTTMPYSAITREQASAIRSYLATLKTNKQSP